MNKDTEKMIQEEQILRETYGQRNCFKVPEGYFEQLTSTVMAQLPQQQARTVVLRPWYYAAACALLALVMGSAYYLHLQSSADMVADASYYEEVADYAMIDNMDIYACMTDE